MKYKTTKKEVINGYRTVISVGFCALQTLLSLENPAAYTTRAEGWGADIYEFDGIAICEGNAPFGHIRADYKTCQKYERQAAEILNHPTLYREYEWRKVALRGLISQFIKEVTAHA